MANVGKLSTELDGIVRSTVGRVTGDKGVANRLKSDQIREPVIEGLRDLKGTLK
jgi:hypothetical protein